MPERADDDGKRDNAVETWFNLSPGYREAILREHGLVPPWERKPLTRWQRIVRFFRGY